ncbi:Protein CBG27791 [Caenorhabditis briggsae]|uniref:Protein CBG27791 n=1 Tax=Caenorhabditis briggsae TaxID=6238 RepID=B6II28_CAEBR|nr:Protein CBG27791 [Caenorhabditis briggsae]CAR99558.1 Protein CBG27791 [Caenorhabditis briggsae]
MQLPPDEDEEFDDDSVDMQLLPSLKMVKALRIAMTSFQPVDNVSKGQIMEEELIQEEEVQQEEDPEEEVLEEEVQEEVVQWEEFLEVEFQEEEAQEEQQQILRGDLQQENDNLLTLQLHLHATPVEEAKLEERNCPLPSCVIKKCLSGGKISNLQLVSLLLEQDSIDELEKHYQNKKLENIEHMHLEDVMISEDQEDREDALMTLF